MVIISTEPCAQHNNVSTFMHLQISCCHCYLDRITDAIKENRKLQHITADVWVLENFMK